MTKEIRQRDLIREFEAAYNDVQDGIVRAAEIYVQAVDADKANRERFAKHFADTIPQDAWDKLEAIGRKYIHPKLLMGFGGRHAKRIRKLPYHVQEQILAGEKFDYLTASGSTLKIDALGCTESQARQLFDTTRIRPVPDQRAWIEAERMERQLAKADEAEPYEILRKKKEVLFRRDTRISFEQLKNLALQCV